MTTATCSSGFEWMKNENGQDPCTISSWLIEACQDESSNEPASLAPLRGSTMGYSPPNGTSATSCTCSWSFYNNIEGCTVCQGLSAAEYPSWSNNCALSRLASSSSYWPSNISFSTHTKLPAWSIVNPIKWSSGTFNLYQARTVDENGIPDATDAFDSQPSVIYSSPASNKSNKSQTGAIIGGAMGGVGILAACVALWLYQRQRRKSKGVYRRRRLDLMAAVSGLEEIKGNPLVEHLQRHSWHEPDAPVCPVSYVTGPEAAVRQPFFTGYPVSSSSSPPSGPMASGVPGIIYSQRVLKHSLPTVAEQLDEKRRILSLKQNDRATRRISLFNSKGRESVDLGSDSVAISHAHSHFYAHVVEPNLLQPLPEPVVQSIPVAATEKVGAMSMPELKSGSADRREGVRWSRVVMNPGSASPSGSSYSEGANLNDGAPQPYKISTTPTVVTQIPGARLSTARDRQVPPPSYI